MCILHNAIAFLQHTISEMSQVVVDEPVTDQVLDIVLERGDEDMASDPYVVFKAQEVVN